MRNSRKYSSVLGKRTHMGISILKSVPIWVPMSRSTASWDSSYLGYPRCRRMASNPQYEDAVTKEQREYREEEARLAYSFGVLAPHLDTRYFIHREKRRKKVNIQ